MQQPIPPVLGSFGDDAPVRDASAWPARRRLIKRALEEHVYGPAPEAIEPVVRKVRLAAADAGGIERVEQWEVNLGRAGRFHLALVLPPGEGPFPVIVAQNFCGLRAAFPGRPRALASPLQFYPCLCRSAPAPLMRAMLGQYINGPPFEMIAARGYALALFYPGDVVPDRRDDARRAMAAFAPPETGMLMAWAWTHNRALDAVLADERIDGSRTVAWGQSRNGKAALLAGAFDERFAAVVALQAGRGGDALTAHRSGESVASVTRMFPYWFAPRFRDYAKAPPPVDQHQLLAMAAPRPLLLLHAKGDHWADPEGVRLSAEAATPAFALNRAAPPQLTMRDGWHGIHGSDWRATLDFLDGRFSPVRAPAPLPG